MSLARQQKLIYVHGDPVVGSPVHGGIIPPHGSPNTPYGTSQTGPIHGLTNVDPSGGGQLSDNFNTAGTPDVTKWSIGAGMAGTRPPASTTGQTATNVGGSLQLKNTTGASAREICAISVNPISLTAFNDWVWKISNDGGTDQGFSIGTPGNNQLILRVADVSGTITFDKVDAANAYTSIQAVGSIVIPTTPWRRLNYNPGTDKFQVFYAGSGASNPPISGDWTALGVAVANPGINVTSATVAFYKKNDVGDTVNAFFGVDCFNVAAG